jgi:nucleoside-diphosphate-sugar epimerase
MLKVFFGLRFFGKKNLKKWQVKRFLYTSSACIYPEHKQLDTDMQAGLKEEDAWSKILKRPQSQNTSIL